MGQQHWLVTSTPPLSARVVLCPAARFWRLLSEIAFRPLYTLMMPPTSHAPKFQPAYSPIPTIAARRTAIATVP
jgi:hypothetical protein